MTLNEKASYIKGLCDGMELDTTSKEGKVIAALLDLVSDMALAIEDLDDEVADLGDYVEEISIISWRITSLTSFSAHL